MPATEIEQIVSAIVDDFKEGVTSPTEMSWAPLRRAVGAIRQQAFAKQTFISKEHATRLDVAIRIAQPYLTYGADGTGRLLMVCCLHVLVGHWRRVDENPLSPTVVEEAFTMIELLENRLEHDSLMAELAAKRAGSEDHRLVELARHLYPRLLNPIN